MSDLQVIEAEDALPVVHDVHRVFPESIPRFGELDVVEDLLDGVDAELATDGADSR